MSARCPTCDLPPGPGDVEPDGWAWCSFCQAEWTSPLLRAALGHPPDCERCGMQLAEYAGPDGSGWICVVCEGDEP